MPVVDTEYGRVGGLICWESESSAMIYVCRLLTTFQDFMPLSRYILYKKGVEM